MKYGHLRPSFFWYDNKNESYHQCCYALVHHHLLIYDHIGPVWKLFQPWLHIRMHDKDVFMTYYAYVVRFNSEDQGSHGTLCFYLIQIIYIFILKCRIPRSSYPTTARAYLSLIVLLVLEALETF